MSAFAAVAVLCVPGTTPASAAGNLSAVGNLRDTGNLSAVGNLSDTGYASAAGSRGPWDVRLLGEQVVPKGSVVDGMSIGELSGIDYDRRTGRWYLISDDISEGPARFFTARLDLDSGGLHEVRWIDATSIRSRDGGEFPSDGTHDARTVDPESIRVDPRTGGLWWSNEGQRSVPDDGSAPSLSDPWVRAMTPGGEFVRETGQPERFEMSAEETGPRANGVFEGLTLTPDGRYLVTSLETPLYQDGELPTAGSGSLNRLTWYDTRTGRPVRQVAYPVDPVPVEGDGGNGISEILAVDRHHYLVVERSYVSGHGNTIRVFLIDVRGAGNVLPDDSLSDGHPQTVRKRLVLDFATLGLDKVDNIEAVSWGPRLRTGERTLVFVSDDNYNDTQISQVVAVAVDLHGGS